MEDFDRACQHWARGEPEEALALGEGLLERARGAADPVAEVMAHLVLARAYHALGLFSPALVEIHAVLDRADGAGPAEVPVGFDQAGGSPRAEIERAMGILGFAEGSLAGACALGAECLGELGDHAGALDLLDRGERAVAASPAGRGPTLAAARGHVYLRRGAVDAALAALEPAVRAGRERSLLAPLGHALTVLGDALTRSGRPVAGVEAVREAIGIQETSGALAHRAHRYVVLAAAHAGEHRREAATHAATEGLRLAERHAERAWEAWSHHALGEIARAAGDARRAESHYDAAQEIAEELAMRPLLEHCRAAFRALR